ncbi:MAG: peptidoglycan DD-metalloendopeptidase family protein [Pseudomonadota bacterium]
MRGLRRDCVRSSVSRLGVAVAIAGLAAGCSAGNVRLSGVPLFSANNPAGPTALAPVESRDLPPATIPPAGQITTPASLKAQGLTLENAPIVEVGPADTAATLSQGFGIPPAAILTANGLTDASQIRPGQRLVIPVKAPATSFAAAPATTTPGPVSLTGAPPVSLDQQAREGRHTVAVGETLWSISMRYGVSPADVRALNGLPANGAVQFGQVLRIPGTATKPAAPAPTEVATISPATAVDASVETAVVPGALPQAEPKLTAPAPQQQAPQQAKIEAQPRSGAPSFRWPVRGRIISGFGKQADGVRNDGINLAVPAGTPVRAAENGTVIYAGNELEGYGNLVLVQHADDWVSAYAHNEALKVSRGDKVQRGETIASVGKSGAVDQPQLHFELRKRSKPVDPLPHLSGA